MAYVEIQVWVLISQVWAHLGDLELVAQFLWVSVSPDLTFRVMWPSYGPFAQPDMLWQFRRAHHALPKLSPDRFNALYWKKCTKGHLSGAVPCGIIPSVVSGNVTTWQLSQSWVLSLLHVAINLLHSSLPKHRTTLNCDSYSHRGHTTRNLHIHPPENLLAFSKPKDWLSCLSHCATPIFLAAYGYDVFLFPRGVLL